MCLVLTVICKMNARLVELDGEKTCIARNQLEPEDKDAIQCTAYVYVKENEWKCYQAEDNTSRQ